MGKIKVAIDGPAGAGKSTAARLLAQRIGYTYIDTGAMYRAVALLTIRNNIPPTDEDKIIELLEKTKIKQIGGKTYLDDEDVSIEIRSNSVSRTVSIVCQHQKVRNFLVPIQREMAKNSGVVVDGRDIGTVVLPDAELKIFLVASPQERARRRFVELQEMGKPLLFEEVLENILRRDALDSTRATAPLKKADDAIVIDNTNMSIEEEINYLEKLVREKEKDKNATGDNL